MIIVTQSRNMIINFNKILALGISSLEDKSFAIKVYYNLNDKNALTIGRYSDVLIARKIIDDILYTFENCNCFSSGFIKNDIYYMPKE